MDKGISRKGHIMTAESNTIKCGADFKAMTAYQIQRFTSIPSPKSDYELKPTLKDDDLCIREVKKGWNANWEPAPAWLTEQYQDWLAEEALLGELDE